VKKKANRDTRSGEKRNAWENVEKSLSCTISKKRTFAAHAGGTGDTARSDQRPASSRNQVEGGESVGVETRGKVNGGEKSRVLMREGSWGKSE